MTYVQKGAGLKTQQRRPIHSRDMLWLDVNGYAILNAYRQPFQLEVIDYVTHLSPPTKCLVGGDFNAWHDMFEPGIQTLHQGAELARWATESGMDFIGTPGAPTQRAGHVLDLTFSNVPFAQTTIQTNMHSGLDHET
jgi:Endonuclease-reverse transcriptase